MGKYIFYIFALFFLLACDKENKDNFPVPPPEEVQDTLFWDMPHTLFLGLQGPVKSSVLTGIGEDGEGLIQQIIEFDSCGRLSCYDPAGLSAMSFRSAARPYDIGWIDPTVYRYRYNREGLLTEIVFETMAIDTIIYRLDYGNHDCYVPLPFVLGDCPVFLLKGLEKIESEGFSYTFNGTTASFQRKSWDGTTSVVYHFNGNYPDKRWETLYRGSDTITQSVTDYVFGADGRPVSENTVRSYREENSVRRTEIVYAPVGLLLPESQSEWLGEEIAVQYMYTYDAAGNLTMKTVKREENVEKEESNTYSAPDAHGNWTQRKCTLPGMGTLDYKRLVVYY